MPDKSPKPIRVQAFLTRIATLELDRNVEFQQKESNLVWNLLQQYNRVQADRGNRRRLLLEPLGGEDGIPDEIAVYEMEAAMTEEDLEGRGRDSLTCKDCGAVNIPQAIFCMGCGARLEK